MIEISLKNIEKATKNLNGTVKNTPLEICKRLSKKYQANVYLKREDLQEVRSFKIRGAYNKIRSLSLREKKQGVVCASAGNHAQGVALSCSKLKIKGTIFMPIVTPSQKIQRVKEFGGEYIKINLFGDTYDDACYEAQQYCRQKKSIFVHAFNDEEVINGQGTIGKEIYDELDGKIDYVLVQIGGGGLISGIGTYFKGKDEKINVIGVESNNQASMHESIKIGKIVNLEKIDTFVEGTAVREVGKKTFETVKKVVDNIVLVEDGLICSEMIDLYQNEGIVAEPAGAVSVAGLEKISEKIKGKNVVCIISGGNNDILRYPEILEKSLVYKGLKHYFILELAQKPGQLKRFVNEALGPNDDIVRFEYIKKSNKEKAPILVGVELKNKEDFEPLIQRMNTIGFKYRQISSEDILYNYII